MWAIRRLRLGLIGIYAKTEGCMGIKGVKVRQEVLGRTNDTNLNVKCLSWLYVEAGEI